MPTATPFPLPPEVTRVILGGVSAIDLKGLNLQDRDEAREFAIRYGYDMDVPHQRLHVVKVFEDALSFLQGVILDGTGLDVPPEFADLQDPLELLLWASERPRADRARWSCALLRVMHTLFHVDHNLYLRSLPDIQQQVFERYDRFLAPEADGRWMLKGRYEVPLLAVRRKENKDRISMLLKLLHKPENVAETIYDQVGIRFVAEDLLGVLETIRFLFDHNLLMPTQIKPSRTRNRMVDMEALERWTRDLPTGFRTGDLNRAERAALSRALAHSGREGDINPFSSSDYSAVQFTAKTLIRLPSPAVQVLNRIQKRFDAMGRPEIGDLLHIPELIQEQDEFTFFFAHEVQIMERSGYENTLSGPASHAEYKLRQLEAARKRVLQGILTQEATC